MDYIVDIETDGVNPSKIHCMSVKTAQGAEGNIDTHTDYVSMTNFITGLSREDRIIGHNFIRYDAPVIERILAIKIKAKLVDTLALSWYLYPEQRRHGLAQWGEKLGVPKPVVEDWDNACIQTYIHRCEEDVKINHRLWNIQKDYLETLYAEQGYDHLLGYLTHKMNCARLQEKSKWKLNVHAAYELLHKMEAEYDLAVVALGAVMPKVEKTAIRKRPAKPYKQDGTLSSHGMKWQVLCEMNGLDFDTTQEIEVITGFEEPNPTSVVQIKNWLTELGWKPRTFKHAKDNKRIPQIKNGDGELCSSIEVLAKDTPELSHLASMTVTKHRIGLVQGLIQNHVDGYVEAQIQGLTNTLRFKHAVCVNIPSLRKPYGKQIRGLLTSDEGNVLCGSDMSSLEDRTKQHFMWEYDPEYVKEMQVEGFDPHLDLALSAGAVNQQEVDDYKSGKDKSITPIRHNYKGGNYACTYGCGVVTLARQLGITKSQAARIHKAYWSRNWSLKEISKAVKTKQDWLYNPVSKIWYKLRSEKDIFSTLNQGTGVYCFDLWIGFILQKRPQLTAQFHDEIILELQKGDEDKIEDILKQSIAKVNKLLKLNRDLDCDVQFGKNYSQIH